MPTPQEAKRLFSQVVRRRDCEISLIDAALLIAAGQGSGIDPELCLGKLASMVHRVQALLQSEGIYDPRQAPFETILTLNRVLFLEEGFSGNREDYCDIANSCIDMVIERRTGIPISLSLVYMEVARQVGLPMHGIGLPGHFMVGYWPSRECRLPAAIIDPFEGGRAVTLEECAAQVHAAYGDDVRFTIDWLQPMSHRQIIGRMLSNLKHIYVSAHRYDEALRVIDMLLAVQPDAIWELKDRGLIYYRTGSFMPALADLKRYLRYAPRTEDSVLLNYYVELLERLIASRN